MMKRFESDYLEGAHPDVLRALIETNGEQTPGYGEDPHCEAAPCCASAANCRRARCSSSSAARRSTAP